MKVQLNEKILSVDGTSPLNNPETGRILTLRDVCVNSLLSPIQEDNEVKKYEKYELFKKIRDASSEVELKAEEIVIIKKCIGHFQPPLILGQAYDLLDS